ncbi:MAG: hypothetical protein LBC41_10780 [Clostridiales bacterium]|nr:hypothetical protein [Clostridiales bacterium]
MSKRRNWKKTSYLDIDQVRNYVLSAILILVFLGVACWILFASGVFAFGQEPIKSYATVFVIKAHKNSKTINFDNEVISKSIERLAISYGKYTVIVADGSPTQQASTTSLEAPSAGTKLINFLSNTDKLDQREKAIKDYLKMQKPLTSETDALEAIDTAARYLKDVDAEVKEIIVLGTGLSTAGLLNFAENEGYLYTSPESIVSILQKDKNLPDLSGIKVIWCQMHDVHEPQEAFDGTQKENLEEIWRGIIENGGGRLEIVSSPPGNDFYGSDKSPDYPEVSVVNIRPKDPVVISVVVSPKVSIVERGDTHKFQAVVEGLNGPAQEVTWSVTGASDEKTKIDKDGLLYVSPDESETSLTVTAKALTDPAKFAEVYVTIPAVIGTGILGVKISPSSLVAKKGENYQLDATVLSSKNSDDTAVSWSVQGGGANTSISQNGLLSVGKDEEASTVTIIATSQADTGVAGELPVMVTPNEVKVMFLANQPEASVPGNNGKEYFANGREAAIEVIKDWVGYIDSQGNGIYLFGCTAKDDSPQNEGYEKHRQLGRRRADAVREILITEFNVDPRKIVTVGLGYDNPWHKDNGINNLFWNEDAAKENRKTYVLPIGDAVADHLASQNS